MLHDVFRHCDGDACSSCCERTVALARAARAGDDAAADELAELVAGLDLAEIELLVRVADALVSARQPGRGQRARPPPPGPRRRETPPPRAGSIARGDRRARRARDERRRARELLEPRRAAAGDDRAPDRGAAPHDDRQARAGVRDAARARRARRPRPRRRPRERLRATVQELWGSDELRATSLTVLDEVRGGLLHFATTLADTVRASTAISRRRCAEHYPDAAIDVPPLLGFGSWIGGDRDGNPYVTPETTVQALDADARAVPALPRGAGRAARRAAVAVGARQRPGAGLEPILERGAELFPELAEQLRELNPEEPYRRALTFMRERVRATPRRDAGRLRRAGRAARRPARASSARCATAPGAFTAAGDLHDVIRQVEVFGFHFATLDIREHAKVHRARARTRSTRRSAICDDYAALAERDRIALLCRRHRRPAPADSRRHRAASRTRPARRSRPSGCCAARSSGAHRGAIQTYIVSRHRGAGGPARGAAADEGGEPRERRRRGRVLRIVPLFEAGRDARAAAPRRWPSCCAAGLPRGAARGRRRAGGDDRLLGLQQGRRLRRLGLGGIQGADADRRGAARSTASAGSSSMAAAARSGAAAARRTARSWRCRRAPSTGA